LRAAARRLDCETLLGLADIQEIRDCFEESGPWGYRDYHRTAYDYEADEVEDEVEDEDEVEWHGNVPGRARGYRHSDLILNELIESGVELRDLLDEAGKPAGLSPLGVDTTELCFTRANDDADPFRSEYEPYMGNYGNTLDRWYRRAAVVLWPRERAFSIRGRGDPSWAIGRSPRACPGRRRRTRAALSAPCCRPGTVRPRPVGPSGCSRGPSRWPASSPIRSWRQACCSRCRRQIFPGPQCPSSPV
jgi:hypothetical protein